MNDEHIQAFQTRLIGLFESKAQEFTKYSQEDAFTAPVAAQLAGLYSELVEVMKA
jgi:hypothetical protein